MSLPTARGGLMAKKAKKAAKKVAKKSKAKKARKLTGAAKRKRKGGGPGG